MKRMVVFVLAVVFMLVLSAPAMAISAANDDCKVEIGSYRHSCGNYAQVYNAWFGDDFKFDCENNTVSFCLVVAYNCSKCGLNHRTDSTGDIPRTFESTCAHDTELSFYIKGAEVGADGDFSFKMTIPAKEHTPAAKYDADFHWNGCSECELAENKAEHTMAAGQGYKYCTECEYREYPAPETGDGANLVLWSALVLMSVAGMILMRKKKAI